MRHLAMQDLIPWPGLRGWGTADPSGQLLGYG